MLFVVVFSCWIAALTYVLFVCHGTLVRLTCLSSIQIDVFWFVYLASCCLGLLEICFKWCYYPVEKFFQCVCLKSI